MATNISLEECLAAVEEAISELRKQVAAPHPTDWLQQITGSFEDDSVFDEILAYGKAIRAGGDFLLSAEDESWNIFSTLTISAFFSGRQGKITATFCYA